MKRFCFVPLLVLLIIAPLFTQAQLYDSLRASIHMKPTIHFKLDSRNSFISARRAQIWGIKLGADFGNKLRLGFGYNFLNSDVSTELYNPPEFNHDTVTRTLKAHYGCAYIEYVFYRQGHWEFSVPVQFSIGNTYYIYQAEGAESLRSENHLLMLYEPTLSGQYKVFSWFGVGADLGFRYALVKSRSVDEKFSSPIYVFKILVYWGDLYKKAFPKHPIDQMIKKIF